MGETSWIFVTGGVLSGLGKGVAAASIGNLLAQHHSITPVKCDGYLNVDPGTMNPVEHGEVFVLDDGGEVDMDFGHYERFLGVTCKREWNLTMGKVFERVRDQERRGDYLGKTVQMVPHITDAIKDWWKELAQKEESDVMLVEIGGTIGDIENELYLEAARQMRADGEKVLYVHLTYVPHLANVNEQKSKPTQQSVALLRSRGIQPDVILARCEAPLQEGMRNKIATFCGVKKTNVLSAVDVSSVYEIPLRFAQEGIIDILADFGLQASVNQKWSLMVERMNNPRHKVNIAIAGKYTRLEDSYASVVEALKHAGAAHDAKVNITWLETSEETPDLSNIHGVIVPGGFGGRGVEGKIAVAKYCREKNIPYLGICYGLQMAVIEHARSLGLEANTIEADAQTPDPVITFLEEQKSITDKGGTMRLGGYVAHLREGKVLQVYGNSQVTERHRHRYEVNPKYHELLEQKGLVFCGMSPDRELVEFIERTDHPYFVATQAHPELTSSPIAPAPLFSGLIAAALQQQ